MRNPGPFRRDLAERMSFEVFGEILGEIRCYSTGNSVRDSGSFQRDFAERMSFEVDVASDLWS